MKNIIIFGQPRCGKSTLANMIVDKFGYQVIHVDSIRDTFKKVYPELGITPNEAIKNEKFQLFLHEYLNRNTIKEERNKYSYVVEGCETSVDDCNKLYNNGNNIIYYLGATQITPNELLNNIRSHDTSCDWTNKLSDDKLMKCVKNIISKSIDIENDCKKYNINFIDTSINREKKLNIIIKDIECELKKENKI